MGRTKRQDSKAGPAEPTPTPAPTEKARGRSRKKRSRPIPKWLKDSNELDAIAQRRCLMLLSVLSGERPVTDVIEQLQISRGTYYQLEDRAVRAMLGAMMPGAGDAPASAAIPLKRIAELEAQVQRLEQDKRRLERLLHLTRRVLKPGPVTTPEGGGRPRGWPKGKPRKPTSSSEASGSSASPDSTMTKTSSPSPSTTPTPSIPSPSSGGAAG